MYNLISVYENINKFYRVSPHRYQAEVRFGRVRGPLWMVLFQN